MCDFNIDLSVRYFEKKKRKNAPTDMHQMLGRLLSTSY